MSTIMNPFRGLRTTLRRWKRSGEHAHWMTLIRAEVRWLLSCGECPARIYEVAAGFGCSL